MVLKTLGFVGFTFLFAIGARADANPEMCERVEKTYRDFEKTTDCNALALPGNPEYRTYRPMCAGCDPKEDLVETNRNAGEDVTARRMRPNAANPGGKKPGFDVGNADPAAPNVLADLNRLPTDDALARMLYPNLDKSKCKDAAYKSANPGQCEDFFKLQNIAYGDVGNAIADEQGPLDDAIAKAHGTVDRATTKAAARQDRSIFEKACNEQNDRYAKVRNGYNARLGKHKKEIWTNIVKEMGVNRGCLSRYVDELPNLWCGDSFDKGELPATNQEACLKKLAADPKLFEKFERFAADPATLTERYNRRNKMIGDARPPAIQPIDSAATKRIMDPWASKVLPDGKASSGTKSSPALKSMDAR